MTQFEELKEAAQQAAGGTTPEQTAKDVWNLVVAKHGGDVELALQAMPGIALWGFVTGMCDLHEETAKDMRATGREHQIVPLAMALVAAFQNMQEKQCNRFTAYMANAILRSTQR